MYLCLRLYAVMCYNAQSKFKGATMSVGKEDFEAGVYGDTLSRVMKWLPDDKALMQGEIEELTGLRTKVLNDALPALLGLGYIQDKWINESRYYMKIVSVLHQGWYTIDEAANYLRVSRRTIYQLLQTGQLVSYRVGKRGHTRFKHEHLDRVMQKEESVESYAMSAVADPVLAELWDNDKDAEYDSI